MSRPNFFRGDQFFVSKEIPTWAKSNRLSLKRVFCCPCNQLLLEFEEKNGDGCQYI